MSESARRVDLRLIIPAAADYHALAADVAEKFAECTGADPARARQFAARVRASVEKAAPGGHGRAIAIELAADGHELIVTAHAAADADHRTHHRRD